ncbi:MAG: hypothetical protein IPH48_16450 [bacterium]|nr:hypothetical protein [bacterium]
MMPSEPLGSVPSSIGPWIQSSHWAAATVGSISAEASTIATATADFIRERMGDLLGRTG